MIPTGSEPPRPLHTLLALAVTFLGLGAMVGSVWLAPRLGLTLGVRGQIAFGTMLLAVPALAALAGQPPAWKAALGPGALTGRIALLSAFLGATLWVGSLGLIELQSLFKPPTPQELDFFRRIHAALAPSGVVDGLVSLTVIALLPALCEELVMRGVLLPSLAVWTGRGLAVCLTALVFGLIHDPIRLLFTFVLGVLLGLLRLRTRSLWPPVIVHSTLNALTFFIAPLVDDPTQVYTPNPALGLLCLGAGALVSWPLLRALRPSVDSPGTAA